MKRNRLRSRNAVRPKPVVLAVYVLLRLIVAGVLVLSLLRRDYESAFTCVLVLILYMLPQFVQRNFHVALPTATEIIILLFIFAAEILGELGSYFVQYTHWDTMLHTTTGFLAAAFGYSMVDFLNRHTEKISLSPLFMALVSFCFSVTLAALWELFEFAVDQLARSDMQKDTVIHSFSSVLLDPTNRNVPIRVENIRDVAVNGRSLGVDGYLDIGLYDTMEDLLVSFLGALLFSVIGYFSTKRGDGRVEKLVPTVLPVEEAAERT